MSFYRTLLAAVAAAVIASPVFAAEATPAQAEGVTQQSTASDQATPTEAKVKINKATPKDLMKLKGINASKARALIACRNKQQHQVFKSLDDIAKCKKPKFKPEALKTITDQLTID